jgi:hypothetical protein
MPSYAIGNLHRKNESQPQQCFVHFIDTPMNGHQSRHDHPPSSLEKHTSNIKSRPNSQSPASCLNQLGNAGPFPFLIRKRLAGGMLNVISNWYVPYGRQVSATVKSLATFPFPNGEASLALRVALICRLKTTTGRWDANARLEFS